MVLGFASQPTKLCLKFESALSKYIAQMDYILIVEKNYKENESYLLYCQWTGNEVELEKLINVIETAEYEMSGDYSVLQVSRKLIPETAVDAHVCIKDFGDYIHMFQKCKGTFLCPEFSESPFQAARELNRMFWHGRLRNYFSETAEELRKRMEKIAKIH